MKSGHYIAQSAAANLSKVNPAIAQGLEYLWLGKYLEASNHFEAETAKSADEASLLGLAGTAKWCLDDIDGAIQIWSKFFDVATLESARQQIHLAILLQAASTIKEDYRLEKRVSEVLYAEIVGGLRTWPAPLISAALGMTRELHPFEDWLRTSGVETPQRRWAIEFHRTIDRFKLRSFPDHRDLRVNELNAGMIRITGSEWIYPSNPELFAIVSQEEFFIARKLACEKLPILPPPIKVDEFDLLRKGNVSEGLRIAEAAFKKDPSVSNTISLGAVYLWMEDYKAAWKHFQDAIENQRWTHDSYFEMAGTAKWCTNEPRDAVDCWKSGLHCDYGDAAGSVGNQLLLFAASILREGVIPQAKALALLEKKASNPAIESWPGPLVELCLGKSHVDFRLENAKHTIHTREALIKFYQSVLAFRDGELTLDGLHGRMREMIDTSRPEWNELKTFTSLIRNYSEFFIARHESTNKLS